ncbi:MAG: hypothetical protein NC218_10870 [Acetobacter sp.]|nr:hypothetical protein [Acetobacter sp.]
MDNVTTKNNIGTEAIDFLADFNDSLLRLALNDGILKEIPLIKSAVTLCKLAQDIPNYFFLRNLNVFLKTADTLDEQEFAKAKEKFSNYEDKEKLGENILYILTHSEDNQKVKILAKALTLLNQDDIDVPFYLTFCFHIVNCCSNDLKYILYFKEQNSIITSINPNIPEETLNSLFSNSFLYDCGFDGGDLSGTYGGTKFGLSKYGDILKKILSE